MFERLAVGLAVAAVAAAAAACGGSANTTPASTAPTQTEALDTAVPGPSAPAPSIPEADAVFDDPSEPVEVAAGDTFALSLDASPATGNAWSITRASDPKVAEGRGHQFSADPDAEGATELGGTDLWTFAAVGRGETSMTLAYGKPGSPPETTATFRVVVR